MAARSTGEPSMVTPPGRVSALLTPIWRKSRCRPAVIRVVSAFQDKMSNGGVVRPQPGEHLGQRPAVQVAACGGRGGGQPRVPLADDGAAQAGPRLVQHGD